MTNEFAIKVLTELRGYGDKFANIGFDRKEALDMAIKALEQQPCEDCISREAVMKCFKKWQPYMATRLWDYEQELKALSSVTPSYNSVKTELKPCEDCISRQQAIDKMQELEDEDIKAYGCEIPESFDGKRAIRALKTLPSVTTKAETGHWIIIREEFEFMGGIVNEPRGCKCSNCNKVVRFKSDFCPNCGADMRGESE